MDFANTASSCASDNGTNLTMLILSQLQLPKYWDVHFWYRYWYTFWYKYPETHRNKEPGNSAIT